MATTLSPQTFTRLAGINLDDVATAADVTGNNWANTGSQFLYINNASGSPITVTQVFGTNNSVDSQVAPNRTTTVAAGKRMLLGPWPSTNYNDNTSPAKMNVTYSAVTSVTVAVLQWN